MFEKIMTKLLSFLPCAFSAADMNRVHAGTVTIWAYKSNDTLASIVASGYFDSYVSELRQGDQILIAADLDGTPARDSAIVSSADNVTPVTTAVKT